MAEMFYKCFMLFVIVRNFVLGDIPQISLSIENKTSAFVSFVYPST